MSIRLENVTKAYEGRIIFKNVDLSLEDGKRYCLFGPSGCGKTTLMRIIGGLTEADSGMIIRDPGQTLAVHFQENRLIPWLTIEKNLLTVMNRDTMTELLNRVELTDILHQYPDELSGGMKRRISLARALGADSNIILLDEPLRELDEEMIRKMIVLIREKTEEKMLVMVTHDREQAELVGCEILDMNRLEIKRTSMIK